MENMLKTMKQEKMITKVDTLGRIVIYKELRKSLNIKTEERLYVYREGTKIIIEKSDADTENKEKILRAVDELSRYVIPKQIRNELKIEENDNLNIYIENEKFILEKE